MSSKRSAKHSVIEKKAAHVLKAFDNALVEAEDSALMLASKLALVRESYALVRDEVFSRLGSNGHEGER